MRQTFSALRETEAKQYASLATSNPEKELIAQLKQLRLARKLLDFELTSDEWTEYSAMQDEPSLVASGRLMSPFATFYREAIARNASMSANLLRQMDEREAKTAVLVTGDSIPPDSMRC